MAALYGTWTAPSLDGPRTITTNGVTHHVPDDAEIKTVKAGKLDVAHILHNGHVYVLAAEGQLLENASEAKRRALAANWREVASS